MTAIEAHRVRSKEFAQPPWRPRGMRLALAACGLLSLVAVAAPAAQDHATPKPARRKPDFRTELLASLDAWLAQRLPKSTDLEIDGTIRSMPEIRKRVEAMPSRDKSARSLALAMADDVISRVLEDALRGSGHWVSDEKFDAVFTEHRAPYDDTPFGIAVIAVNYKGFPGLDAYRRRFRLLHAYERSIGAQIDQATLRAHSRTGPFFADQSVGASVLQFVPKGDDGEARAAERGRRARDAWASGAAYDDLAAKADLARAAHAWMPGQMRDVLRENEYTDLLAHSVTATVLWHAKQGEIVGPLRGVDAYWVVRVDGRKAANPPLNMDLEHVQRLVRQDYVQQRFLAWATSVLDRATLRVHLR